MASSISVEKLTKVYDLGEIQVRALRGVTVDIDQGEFVAVIGPSGSGKTTLMDIIADENSPDNGKVTVKKNVVVAYLKQDNFLDVCLQQCLQDRQFFALGLAD